MYLLVCLRFYLLQQQKEQNIRFLLYIFCLRVCVSLCKYACACNSNYELFYCPNVCLFLCLWFCMFGVCLLCIYILFIMYAVIISVDFVIYSEFSSIIKYHPKCHFFICPFGGEFKVLIPSGMFYLYPSVVWVWIFR